jgi:hypothetical protein
VRSLLEALYNLRVFKCIPLHFTPMHLILSTITLQHLLREPNKTKALIHISILHLKPLHYYISSLKNSSIR